MVDISTKPKSVLEYMATNRIGATVGTLGLLVIGMIALFHTTVERYPALDLRRVTITVPYDGATPREVEEDVLRRIEQSLSALDGVDRITSNAWEGLGEVIVEFEQWQDTVEKLDVVRTAVEGIEDFPPAGADQPEIVKHEILRGALSLVLSSDTASEHQLTLGAEELREALLFLPNVAVVDLYGARERQIQVDLDETKLLSHGLTVDDVISRIRNSSINLTGGEIELHGGALVLSVLQKRTKGSEFADIVILSKSDGSIVRLDDIGTVRDGFIDDPLINTVDGVPAVFIEISAPNGVDPGIVRDEVEAYLASHDPPAGMNLSLWMDRVFSVKKPLLSVADSALVGAALVFVVVVLLLDFRFGFWVAIGIPTAIVGAFAALYLMGMTLNIMAVIGFAVVVGIVVDDAIVVGENIQRHRSGGMPPLRASIQGAREVIAPVTVGVLTTAFVFAALLPLDGVLGMMFSAMAVVVIVVLMFSLLDAFFLLPAHVSGANETSGWPLRIWQRFAQDRFENFTNRRIGGLIRLSQRYPLRFIAFFIVLVGLAVSLLIVNVIRFNTTGNRLDEQQLQIDLTMVSGTTFPETVQAVERIAAAAHAANTSTGGTAVNAVNVMVGQHKSVETAAGVNQTEPGPHLASVQLRLNTYPSREISVAELRNVWVENIGQLKGVETIAFPQASGYSSAGVAFVLLHPSEDALMSVATELKQKMTSYAPIYQVDDTLQLGSRRYEVELTNAAAAAGLTAASVAAQLRNRFFGAEAHRVVRNQEELEVVARYPLQKRTRRTDLNDELIRLPNGELGSFSHYARIVETQDLAQRQRIDGLPAVTINALFNVQATSSREVRALVFGDWLAELSNQYPRLQVLPDGTSRDTSKILGMLSISFPAAVVAMFVLMAIQLRSVVQPLLVLLAIPLAVAGALYLHLALDYDVGLVSIFGIIAAIGVVVNDALVLLDMHNRLRRENPDMRIEEAMTQAALLRARPIVLTTVTTIVGLMPLLYNRAESVEPFLPVVVSLVGGLAVAGISLLIFLPAMMVLIERLGEVVDRYRTLVNEGASSSAAAKT
ncbi:MAG: efflux RND transporter permease subunit [Gammaproteobacteria bacterium]|nr:efflux RND transporter permease subunit [Gammaproteobacteria bacterium]